MQFLAILPELSSLTSRLYLGNPALVQIFQVILCVAYQKELLDIHQL